MPLIPPSYGVNQKCSQTHMSKRPRAGGWTWWSWLPLCPPPGGRSLPQGGGNKMWDNGSSTQSKDSWSHLGCGGWAARLSGRPAGALALLNPPPAICASSALHTVCLSLHRPPSPSFPSRAHHLILIKHAELMLHKSPPVGINIIPLISPSRLARCASPWLRPAFVSGAIHCIWKCYGN